MSKVTYGMYLKHAKVHTNSTDQDIFRRLAAEQLHLFSLPLSFSCHHRKHPIVVIVSATDVFSVAGTGVCRVAVFVILLACKQSPNCVTSSAKLSANQLRLFSSFELSSSPSSASSKHPIGIVISVDTRLQSCHHVLAITCVTAYNSIHCRNHNHLWHIILSLSFSLPLSSFLAIL